MIGVILIMNLEVRLKLSLLKQRYRISVSYNTYEKATYDEYLMSSLALHANDEVAEKYIDDITGDGTLNTHFKRLYYSVSKKSREELERVIKDSLYPVLKIDESNTYLYYPELNISVIKGKVYQGNIESLNMDINKLLMIEDDIVDVRYILESENNDLEPYNVFFNDNKDYEIVIMNNYYKLPIDVFRKTFESDLDNIDDYPAPIITNPSGNSWNILSNSALNNIINSKYFIDGEYLMVIRNDNIRAVRVAMIEGLYIFDEKIIGYVSSAICDKVIKELLNSSMINEFKTKSLINIMHNSSIDYSQKAINYILDKKDSKELALEGISMLKKGYVKGWNDGAINSFNKYCSSSEFKYVYQIESSIDYDEEKLLEVPYELLRDVDKKRVKAFNESLDDKKKLINSILGEVTASGIREGSKALNQNEIVTKFKQLANKYIGHNKINIKEVKSMQRIDQILDDVKRLKDLSDTLLQELDKNQ